MLSYKDPQWMEKAALARARQRKPELAVKALQAAWVEGRPASAANAFRVATQLAAWNLLPQAEVYARQGVHLAGKDLLAVPQNAEGAVVFARLMARQRRAAEVFTLYGPLAAAAGPSPSSPTVVLQQVEKEGLASVTDDDWRKALVARRRQQTQTSFREAVEAIATVAGELYTPEEKATFASLLDARRANRPAQEVVDLWIPAARSAGLFDREVAWRRDVLLHGGALAAAQLTPFDALTAQRMENTTRAETLELYAAGLKLKDQPPVLTMAAQAWQDAGNRARETALLRKLVLARGQREQQERLFDLYLKGDAAALLALTTGREDVADAAANFVLAHGTQAQAFSAVAHRAAARPPVWGSAAQALTGLYFGDTSSRTHAAFATALADGTIGERLQQPPDENRQLIGKPWFYYGTRYGYLLTFSPEPGKDAEDYLPAQLESGSADPAGFNALARTYLDAGRPAQAIAEYRHVMELDPADPTPHVDVAQALWDSGQKDAALAEWRTALTLLRGMVDLRAVPETFWTEFAAVAGSAAQYGLGTQLRPSMDLVLTAYLRKNAGYRANELLTNALGSLVEQQPAEAVAWVLGLIGNAPPESQGAMLADLAAATDFPEAQRESVFLRELALQAAAVQAATDASADYVRSTLTATQARYIRWLIRQQRVADAQRVLDAIPTAPRKDDNAAQDNAAQLADDPAQPGDDELTRLAVYLAARQHRLPPLLSRFQADPSSAPSLSLLAGVANTLRLEKDAAGSRLLLEYVFAARLETQSLTAADFLALAEARLTTGDMPGALDLLRRSMQQGDLYEALDAASRLLMQTGHPAEALPWLTRLAAGVPWNAAFRLRLGEAQAALQQNQAAAATLAATAADAQAAYPLRAIAADALHALPGAKQFASAELTQLAGGTPARPAPLARQAQSARQAQQFQPGQPYFVFSRLSAAAVAPSPQSAALLQAALRSAAEPQLDFFRLQLFRAAMAAGDDRLASVAITPVLAAHPELRSSGRPTPDDETLLAQPTDSADEPTGNAPSDAANDLTATTPSSTTLSPSIEARFTVRAAVRTSRDRRTLLLMLAAMAEHLGEDAQALNDLQAASAIAAAPAPPMTSAAPGSSSPAVLGSARFAANAASSPLARQTAQQIATRIAALQSRFAVARENATRRPVLGKAVEQTVLVQPREPAPTTPPAVEVTP